MKTQETVIMQCKHKARSRQDVMTYFRDIICGTHLKRPCETTYSTKSKICKRKKRAKIVKGEIQGNSQEPENSPNRIALF